MPDVMTSPVAWRPRPAPALLLLALALGMPTHADPARAGAAEPADAERIEVFRPDGSVQCEPGSGTSAAAMAASLEATGIRVHGSRGAHDGLNRPAVCGAPTGNMHVFTIDAADRDAAAALGFRALR